MQRLARHDLPGPGGQRVEHRPFAATQVERPLADPRRAARPVEDQGPEDQFGGGIAAAPASERPDARLQFRRCEGLAQVIVRPQVEPPHPVVERVARGQHQHRHPVALPPQGLKHREAVDVGQSHIEHDQRIGLPRRDHQRVLAGRDMIDRMARRAQQGNDPAGQRCIILDDQNPHRVARP